MNRNIFLYFILSLLFPVSFFGQEYSNPFQLLRLTEDRIEFKDYTPDMEPIKFDAEYSISVEHSISFIQFQGKRWLFLSSPELAIILDGIFPRTMFFGADRPMNVEKYLDPSVHSSSYLIEGNTHYNAENLAYTESNTPWVEGVEGFGIGEILTVEAYSISEIIISNGFVSYNSPCLYSKNSRVKEILISDTAGKLIGTYELQDTPNPQHIPLPGAPYKKIIIEILSVYEGSQYEDTCINFLYVKP